jgi:type I restriction enzyme M protein
LQEWNLSIPLYVKRTSPTVHDADKRTLAKVWAEWETSGRTFWKDMDAVVDVFDGIVEETSALAGDE